MKNRPIQDNDLLDWIDALNNLILFNGRDDSRRIIDEFIAYAKNKGLVQNNSLQLPFENSISPDEEYAYPGNWEIVPLENVAEIIGK